MEKNIVDINKTEFIRQIDERGIFWSYDLKNPEKFPDSILIEHVLRWGDVPDILALFKLFDKDKIKKTWEKTMINDNRIYPHNYYLARVFFGVEEPETILRKENRYERIKKLTS